VDKSTNEDRSRIWWLTHKYICLNSIDKFRWYRVAYAISNAFTHDIGEKYYLRLCRLDGVKNDEIKSRNMLIYCYERANGSISFGTIKKFAELKGYKINKGEDVPIGA